MNTIESSLGEPKKVDQPASQVAPPPDAPQTLFAVNAVGPLPTAILTQESKVFEPKSNGPDQSLLKTNWHSVDKIEVARKELFWASFKQVTESKRDLLIAEGVIKSDQETDIWGRQLWDMLQGKRDLDKDPLFLQFLLYSGLLEPILWEDWGINRNKVVVSKKLGITGFAQLQNMVSSGVGGKTFTHLHLGPGDGTLMRELREEGGVDSTWTQLGIGDRLYFSVEKILQKFMKVPEAPYPSRFVQLLSLFLTRAFRAWYEPGKKLIDLNQIYVILSSNNWIHDYYDIDTGKYMAADDFEEEFPEYLMNEDRLIFSDWVKCKDEKRKRPFEKSLLELYEDIFVPGFVQGIRRPEDGPDLNHTPSVAIDGFIYGKFQELHQHFPPESLSLIHGCRSDSHLSKKDFIRHLHTCLALLQSGGVYDTDGIRNSYSRIHWIREAFETVGDLKDQYRARIVTDSSTGAPLSIFIEKRQDNGLFYSLEQLRKVYDPAQVELIPLERFLEDKEFMQEDQDRRELLELNGGDPIIFKTIRKEVREELESIYGAQPTPEQVRIQHTRRVLKRNILQMRKSD